MKLKWAQTWKTINLIFHKGTLNFLKCGNTNFKLLLNEHDLIELKDKGKRRHKEMKEENRRNGIKIAGEK